MATRTAYLDYRERGASQAATGVRTLGDALGYQKRQALAAVPALRAAQQGTGLLGSVSQSSTAKIAAVSNSLGPFGAGLASIAREGPRAAQGLLMVVAQQERMGLLSRASNFAILGGATAMIAGGVAAVAYADNIIRGADAYSAMTSRIRMFSDGAVEAAQSERALFEMGRETRQGVEQLTTLYTRLTPAVADAGRAQADALQVTELTSKALLIQGANVREAEASTIQFAQALSSGVLRGDELRSLMESSPMLLRYIAQTLEMNGKVGVAFGQMRGLGEKGLLTTEKIMSALLAAAPLIERDFINAPKTAQQGWTVLSDTITRTIGQISQSTGMQASVVAWLTGLATKIDEFRKKALLDPDALAPAEAGIRLIGDALDGAGELAAGVVENFDLLLNAAEALIALKLGDIMVGWFSVAAAKARETYTAVQGFRANGRFNAGAANDQVGAVAALQARSAAEAAAARAAMLTAEAEVKARMATNARAAADAQATAITELKARAGVSAAAVSQAEAVATNLSTVAERAETQAKAASTAATNAATAASARNVVAQQAEAAVTANVTGAMAAKAAVGRALSAVYNMLGGAIGLFTIALGAVIYATMQAQQAWDSKIESLRNAVVVSDELTSISNALASATWAEVPALMAAAQAHREKAAAALEDAIATRDAARARREAAEASMNTGAPLYMAGSGTLASVQEREAAAVVRAAEADAFKAREESYVARTRARVVEARARAEENRTGTDALGRPITGARRQENQRFVTDAQTAGRTEGERVEAALSRQEAASRRDPSNRALANGVSVYRRSFEAASELSTVGAPNVTAPRAPDKPAKKERMSAEDREALSLMERLADGFAMREMMGMEAAGAGRFRLTNEGISVDGTPFVAASEDEARAALAYREQILAVMSVSEDLVAQSGLTRQELVQQAADTLNAALSNSQAARAQEAWTAKMAEARGESLAAAQAQQEIDRAREQGARIAEDEAQAYIALAVAKDKLRRAEEALSIARPVVQTVTRETLDDMGQLPETWNASTGAMGFDFEAAMRDWASARERILAESETRIREAMEAEVLAGTKTREEADAAVAAARLAVEVESAQQISELWRRLREEDDEAWRARRDERLNQERELADSITGGLKDLAFGADAKDVGKRFMSDLLEAAWEELVSNPLNLAIRNWLRSMAQGQQTGQTGGFWSSLGSMFGGGGGAGAGAGAGAGGGSAGGGWVNAIGSFVSSLFGGGGAPPALADGGLPGVRSLPPGLIEGQGGPRDDRIFARVSRHEFISNAEATRKNLPILRALNAGWSLADLLKAPRFASGGLPDDAYSDILRRDVSDAANERGASASPPEGGSGASGPNIDLDVNIINQTREPVSARVNRTLDGLDVILEPAVRSTVAKMGVDGSLGRAGATAPKPRRR